MSWYLLTGPTWPCWRVESQQVIGIRVMQMATGRFTTAEASRIMTENVAAAQAAAFQLATGLSGQHRAGLSEEGAGQRRPRGSSEWRL